MSLLYFTSRILLFVQQYYVVVYWRKDYLCISSYTCVIIPYLFYLQCALHLALSEGAAVQKLASKLLFVNPSDWGDIAASRNERDGLKFAVSSFFVLLFQMVAFLCAFHLLGCRPRAKMYIKCTKGAKVIVRGRFVINSSRKKCVWVQKTRDITPRMYSVSD